MARLVTLGAALLGLAMWTTNCTENAQPGQTCISDLDCARPSICHRVACENKVCAAFPLADCEPCDAGLPNEGCDDQDACTTDRCEDVDGTLEGTCAHSRVPGCEPSCNGNGTCDSGESCSCADCTSDPMCASACNGNNTCDSGEACSCADCTSDPMCASTCMPGTPVPGGAPMITSDLTGVRVCRGGKFFFEGTNFNVNGMCVTCGPNVIGVSVDGAFPTYADVIVPADAVAGVFPLVVDNGAGTATSSSDIELLSQLAPEAVSFSPEMGASGTTVTVTGTDLDQVTSIVLVGAVPVFPTITNQTSTSFDFVLTGPAGVYVLEQVSTTDCGTQITTAPTFTIQ